MNSYVKAAEASTGRRGVNVFNSRHPKLYIETFGYRRFCRELNFKLNASARYHEMPVARLGAIMIVPGRVVDGKSAKSDTNLVGAFLSLQ